MNSLFYLIKDALSVLLSLKFTAITEHKKTQWLKNRVVLVHTVKADCVVNIQSQPKRLTKGVP